MNERLEIFWNEILTHCNRLNAYEFTYIIEYWGILWMPWFIKISGESTNFTANDISTDDLKKLTELNLIEYIEDVEIEKDDLLTIEQKRYRIKLT